MLLSAAVRLPWAGTVTNAVSAVTRPSHSIVVVTAIAQSAKPMPERSGCDVGNKNCYPSFTTISCLASRTHWFHSCGRTRKSCFSPVRCHGRDATGSGGRSEASGRRDRILRHPAHLGTDPATASPYSLCRARRRVVDGSSLLDFFTTQFLPSREGVEPRVPRQVLRWIATRFRSRTTRLLW